MIVHILDQTNITQKDHWDQGYTGQSNGTNSGSGSPKWKCIQSCSWFCSFFKRTLAV